MADKIKLAFALLLIVAGVAGYYYLAESATVIRVAVVLGGVVLAMVVAWLTVPGKQFFVFAKEAKDETKRVVWPSRKETMQTTAIVFVFVVIMAAFLWVVDGVVAFAVQKLISPGG